ncbi:MAG: alpha/beta hydrolase [Pseudomonadota bacterium]
MVEGLELIQRAPGKRRSGARPLLFVHGAYAGAWCWDRGFLEFFAKRGWSASAVSLRGHGPGASAFPPAAGPGLRDYADDVRAARKRVGDNAILIGHSMGAAAIQKLMEDEDAPDAAAFFAPIPLTGLLGPSLRLSLSDPLAFQALMAAQAFGPDAAPPDALARVFFADPATAANAEDFRSESPRALIDLAWLDLPAPHRWRPTQAFVARGSQDLCVSRLEAEGVADALDAPLTDLPGLGHAVMLEAEWRVAAQALLDWLERL